MRSVVFGYLDKFSNAGVVSNVYRLLEIVAGTIISAEAWSVRDEDVKGRSNILRSDPGVFSAGFEAGDFGEVSGYVKRREV